MTADLVQNGTEAEAGDNPPFPSLERANYDQDMPSINLTLQKNKGDVVSVKINILVGVNDEERVDCQNETENRQSAPALLIKGATDYEEGADGHLRGQGGFHEHPTLPGEEIRNLRLRDLCEMDEAGGDDGVEDSDGAEVNPWVGLKKPQAATAAAHQAQPNHITQQVMTGGWENFLPQRNLRILLVEDDNSTRHVVGALLRNCGYEVTSAASVVQAWELLQDKSSHFDLALTDVMLPSFSGISLLAKIMNQESCKQIPVVIMSSLDSVDIVFKCLSKGAVDFLVKPVRKNELKNLWQHVWRKCHHSSGSGSGSGSQTGKVEGLKNMNAVGNDSCSNDNESSNMNAAGGSDNGSGTQSFWTKRGVEVESSHRPTEWDVAHCFQRAKAHAVAQKKLGILPKDKRSSLDAIRGLTSSQAKAPDQVMEKGLEITASRTGASDSQMADNAYLKDANLTVQNVFPLQGVEQNAHLDDEGMPDQGEAALKSETVAIDLLGNIACQAKKKEKQHCSGHGEIDREVCNSPTTKDNVSGSVSLPALELTLKKPHTVEEEDSKVEDRLVLRQSGASAFSRYSNSGAVLQQQLHVPVGAFTLASFSVQGGYVGHTAVAVTAIGANQISELRIATPADRAGPFQGSAEASTPLPLHSQLSCAANNQEMTQSVVGSSGQKIIVQAVKGEGGSASRMPISIAVPARAMQSFDGVGAFASSRHPVFFTHSSKFPWAATNFPDREGQQFEYHGLPLQTHQETYHHSSHHYHHHHVQHHHHHHHAHTNSLSPESPEDEPTVTNPGTGAPQCGSSNMIGTVPGNLGQSGSSNGYYVNGNGNGSASGSNNGSNTHNGNSNGQSGIMATAGAYGDSGNNNGISGSGNKNGISSGNGSGVVVGPEQNCFTRREAALNKFRQKRKERCFEKKVRYQSRKKLAEQRPRVRGQFVRQAITILPTADRRHGNNEFVLAVTADAERD